TVTAQAQSTTATIRSSRRATGRASRAASAGTGCVLPAELERDAAREDEHRAPREADHVLGRGADRDAAGGRAGLGADHDQIGLAPPGPDDCRAKPPGDGLGGLARARVTVLPDRGDGPGPVHVALGQ